MHERVGGAVFIEHGPSMVEYRDYPNSRLLENIGDEAECMQSVDPFTDMWIAEWYLKRKMYQNVLCRLSQTEPASLAINAMIFFLYALQQILTNTWLARANAMMKILEWTFLGRYPIIWAA